MITKGEDAIKRLSAIIPQLPNKKKERFLDAAELLAIVGECVAKEKPKQPDQEAM